MYKECFKTIENNLLYEFEGEKNNDSLQTIYSNLENIIENNKLLKPILQVLNELVQSNQRLSDTMKKNEYLKVKYGFYNQIGYLYFSELVLNKDIIPFFKQLSYCNSLKKSEFKIRYKEILFQANLSAHISLGLLDLKRKVVNKILINHSTYNDEYQMIELICRFCDFKELAIKMKNILNIDVDKIEEILNWHIDNQNEFIQKFDTYIDALSTISLYTYEQKIELFMNKYFYEDKNLIDCYTIVTLNEDN